MTVEQYADIVDLPSGNGVLTGIGDDVKTRYLQRASAKLSGRMAPHWEPPFTSWGADLRGYVADVAFWELLTRERGVDPEAPDMKNFLRASDEAYAWADAVGQGTIVPTGIVDATASEDDGAPDVASQPVMGWMQTSRDGDESEFD